MSSLISILVYFLSFNLYVAEQFDDKRCDAQLIAITEALSDGKLWALQIFDSWGKIASGYLLGNKYSIGSFSQCLNVSVDTDLSGTINGQYCVVTLAVSKNVTKAVSSLINGICLPATCTSEGILQFINSILPDAIEAVQAKCITNDPIPINNVDIAAISILSVIGLLVLLSTIYDVYTTRAEKSNEAHKFLVAFSALTNGRRIFTVKRSGESIDCLNGLRAISAILIVFYHRLVGSTMEGFVENPLEVLEEYKYPTSVLFFFGLLCVDTFLLIGGFFCALTLFYEFEKKAFHVFIRVLRRYMRYTPTLIVTTISFLSIHHHIKRTLEVRDLAVNCERFWWASLLYIQNHVNPNEVCGGHTWYLSVDFQLFLITPFLAYAAWKYGWIGLSPTIGLIAFGCTYILKHCIDKGYRTIMMNFNEVFSEVYAATHARMPPWLIGIILAFVFYKTKDRNISIGKGLSTTLWIVSFALGAAVVGLMHPIFQYKNNQTSLELDAIYNAFHRTVWAIAVAWLIFACHKLKSGGLVRWFLSLPEWQPIARISMAMYISHAFYQILLTEYLKETTTYRIWGVVNAALGDILGNFFVASILSIAVELPFITVTNLVILKALNHKKPEIDQKTEKSLTVGHENLAFTGVVA